MSNNPEVLHLYVDDYPFFYSILFKRMASALHDQGFSVQSVDIGALLINEMERGGWHALAQEEIPDIISALLLSQYNPPLVLNSCSRDLFLAVKEGLKEYVSRVLQGGVDKALRAFNTF